MSRKICWLVFFYRSLIVLHPFQSDRSSRVTPYQILNLFMKSLTSETVRSNWTRLKLKDWLLTLERLGFRGRSCQPSQSKCYVKFACLKPKYIWVDLESLLIYLVWHNSKALVWNGCSVCLTACICFIATTLLSKLWHVSRGLSLVYGWQLGPIISARLSHRVMFLQRPIQNACLSQSNIGFCAYCATIKCRILC